MSKSIDKKKVLILSYFFPPSNVTSAQRAKGWAKYLGEFGYYPIIITRKWEREVKSIVDVATATSAKIEHTVYDNFEVYKLPYKPTIQNRLLIKYGSDKFVFIRNLLRFSELIFHKIFLTASPYYIFFKHAHQLLSSDTEIKLLIASAQPFHLFGIANKLKKKHPKLKWIADYRDDWSTNELINRKKLANKLILALDKIIEKNWLKNASCFISVSKHYVSKIKSITNLNGWVIENGFDESELTDYRKIVATKEFKFLYVGTLYNAQIFEPFLEVFKQLIDKFKAQLKIKLTLQGSLVDYVATNRVETILKNYKANFEITTRVSRVEMLEMYSQSNLLVMFPYDKLKGIPSSKIYEYIGLHKPVLLYPSDNDVIEQILNSSKLGIIPSSKTELYNKLAKIISAHINDEQWFIQPKNIDIAKYSRKQQTKSLSAILNKTIK